MSVAGKLEALDHACAGNVDRSESSGDRDDISSNAGSSPTSNPQPELKLNGSRKASSVDKPSALVAAKKENARQGGTVCGWVRTCRPGGTS